MQLLSLDQVGPLEIEGQSPVVLFGLFLPWNPLLMPTVHISRLFTSKFSSFNKPYNRFRHSLTWQIFPSADS